MRDNFKITLSLLFAVAFFNSVFSADETAKTNLKIEKLSIFKNGLGFFSSSGDLPNGAKTINMGQIPIPVFGTFWVYYPEQLKLQKVKVSLEEYEKTMPALDLFQLLQANPGKKVLIEKHGENKQIIHGIVESLINPEKFPERPNEYFMHQPTDANRRDFDYSQYQNQNKQIAIIRTEKGLAAIEAGSIEHIEFEGDSISREVKSKEKVPVISIELNKASNGEKIKVTYLARGILWMPSYLIDLSDETAASFTANATIINEVADIENASLELITGFPNIKFSDIDNPMGMSQKLSAFITSMTTPENERRQSGRGHGLVMQQAMFSNAPAGFSESEENLFPAYSTAMKGTETEDLFIYPVNNFSLKKNETASIPLYTAKMPYRHIYTWKIEDLLDKENEQQIDRGGNKDREEAETVWHSCRLTNTLKMPLTTAATEFAKDGHFTGQDVCFYTPPGSETTIRMNKALNVPAEQSEFEIERKRNAAEFHGSHYDLVKMKGELKLRNKFEKKIKVEITKELSGEVIEKNPDAKDAQIPKGMKRVNPKHLLTWEIELNPGEEKIMTYTYQLYTRGY